MALSKQGRCLVLGGSGFIGSHLVDRLLLGGYAVRIYDRTSVSGYYLHRYRGPVEYTYGDVCDTRSIRKALTDVDIVYHLISTTVPSTSNDNPVADAESNIVATIRILEACIDVGIKRLVYVSSGGTIYGVTNVMPTSETHPLDPLCSYGITKLTIEKYLALYHQLHDLNYVVLRPGNVYGERPNLLRPQGLVGILMHAIKRPRPILVRGDGTAYRDYVYVEDVVNALYLAACDDLVRCIFNIGTGVGTSTNNLIALVEDITGHKFDVQHVAEQQYDVPCNILDATFAKDRLGWLPSVSLADGLRRTWTWFQETFRMAEGTQ